MRRSRRPARQFSALGSQIGVLLDYLDEHRNDRELGPALRVYFAGGIHDAAQPRWWRSRPRHWRPRCRHRHVDGQRLLFTAEAVADGAVGPVFQRQVLAADRTDLLETAPGHVTAASRALHRRVWQCQAELRDRGVPDREPGRSWSGSMSAGSGGQ